MYFPDLGKSTQIDSGEHVRAIGWLSASEPFSTGKVAGEFSKRLRLLCENWGEATSALYWPAAAGGHECELCGKCRTSGNLGIPDGDLLFVLPEMTSHYVLAHGYRPPEEFIKAVMKCPVPGNSEYADSVAKFREFNQERARR